MRRIAGVFLAVASVLGAQPRKPIQDVRIDILSTMLTGNAGLGEWGFAAVVEADGRRILFDTGARPETVLRNAEELRIDLSGITDVILSHNHGDHTGGLLTLRRELGRRKQSAISKAYVGAGAFWQRSETSVLAAAKNAYESGGGTFTEVASAREIFPGAWLTGPVKRVHAEKNYGGTGKVRNAEGLWVEDNLPEDMSLVLETTKGLVVVAGCGHAGIVNILEQARREISKAPVHAAIGGWHLFAATDEHLDWTASKLKEFGVENFLGAHCTGIEAVYRIRQRAGLTRRTCATGAVGGGFTLKDGLRPGTLAK
ncbi:MAG: MBL fold metallo-hydrolase [Candidatus Solibacter usitatus]|nr:MBL fold metallo-hydrolase [Candidatus Solibacter usitatus]